MERFGKYVIRKPLIGSGFSSARAAICQDPDLMVPVTVKALDETQSRPGLLSAGQWKTRFETEARSLAQFDHPHIIAVKCMEQSGGRPFFVMPCMAGDLSLEMGRDTAATPEDRPRRLAPQRVLSLLRQLAAALAALHRKGLVHRHVHPANILLTARENGQVKLADFGLIKLPDRSNPPLPDHWIGATDYCAPEQREKAGAVECTADVFSLGALAYRLLTGTPPDLTQDAALTLPDGIAPDLAPLVQDCTRPDPSARPAHAGLVLQALGSLTITPPPKPKLQVVQIKKGILVPKPKDPKAAD